MRDGRVVRVARSRASMDAADADVYADVLREPARAEASSRVYRHFQLRELPRWRPARLAARGSSCR